MIDILDCVQKEMPGRIERFGAAHYTGKEFIKVLPCRGHVRVDWTPPSSMSLVL